MRLIYTAVLTLLLAASASATSIVVQARQIQNWSWGGTTATLRIYPTKSFVTSNGVSVMRGTTKSGYQTVNCTVSSAVLNCSSFTIHSTEDALDTTARYVADIYDQSGNLRERWMDAFRVPSSLGGTISWDQIATFNLTSVKILPTTYYNAAQTDAAIAAGAAAAAAGKQDTLVSGTNIKTVEGQSLLGAGNLTVISTLANTYANDLATAASAIGATKTTLPVAADTSVSADLTIPATTCLKFTNEAKITVASGKTLTLGCIEDPDNNQVFAGPGHVVFSAKAMPHFNIAWWAGRDDTADITLALTDALASATANGGGDILIPSGDWETTGGLTVPNGTRLLGQGREATKLNLTANSTYMFRVVGVASDYLRNITFEKMSLKGTAATGDTLLLLTGVAPNSIHFVNVADVGFYDADYGINYLSQAGPDEWQLENLIIDRCMFWNNAVGFRVNSINNSIRINAPFVYVPAGGIGFDIDSAGSLVVRDYTAIGPGGAVDPVTGWSNGATVFKFTRAHNAVLIDGGQDEGAEYLISTGTNPFLESVIAIRGTSVTAKIKANAHTSIYSVNNNYVNGVYQNAAGVVLAVYSDGDYVQPRNLDNSANASPQLDHFTGSTSAVVKTNHLAGLVQKFAQHVEMRAAPALSLATQSITPAFGTTAKPILSIAGDNTGKPLLQLCEEAGANSFCYQAYRDSTDGFLSFRGNQGAPFTGYKWDTTISPPSISTGQVAATQTVVTSTTGPQAYVRYDGSNYATTAVSSGGAVTLDAVGANKQYGFNPPVIVQNGTSATYSRVGGAYTQKFTSQQPATNGSPNDLYVTNLAANTLAVNGDGAELLGVFQTATNANNKRMYVYFGATAIYDSGSLTDSNATISVRVTTLRESNTTLRYVVETNKNGTWSVAYGTVTGLDLAATAYDFKLAGQTTTTTTDLTILMGTVNVRNGR